MEQHDPIDPTHIGNDFEDLEQRRLDALCDLLFEGADHSASDRHFDRSHHSPSDEPKSMHYTPSDESQGSEVGCGAAAPTVNAFHSGASRSSTHPTTTTTAPSLCKPSTQSSPDTPWRVSSGSLSLQERVGVRAPTTKPAARQTQATQHSYTFRTRLSLGTLFTGLLLAAFCFFKGASAPIELTRPIEDIRPGHKVIVDAPEEALATDVARLNGFESSWNASDGKLEVAGVADPLRELTETTNEQITKADYRLVILQAKEVWEDGAYNEINVQTLQPWQWIHENEVHVGSQAPLPLETVEMNLPVGMTGKVLDILPCPQLEQGAGRTVLTTVNRLARGVIELSLRDADGHEETLRPTDEHLFYSTSHGDWLSAGELQVGERLSGTSGPITIAAITPLPGTHRVYNMTVQGEHLYRVANCGVLVHNNCPAWLQKLTAKNINNSGKTQLGKLLGVSEDYAARADRLGRSFFTVPKDLARPLSKAQIWQANEYFLDLIAKRGDEVFVNIPKGEVMERGGNLAKEVNHLVKKWGYVWANQYKLVPGNI